MDEPYEALVRGDYVDERGQYHFGFNERDGDSLIMRMAYAFFKSRKQLQDHGAIGFIPPWFESLQLAKCGESGYGYGFGTDFNTFHWATWAQLERRAYIMSQNDRAFDELDKALMSHPELDEGVTNQRMAALAKSKT